MEYLSFLFMKDHGDHLVDETDNFLDVPQCRTLLRLCMCRPSLGGMEQSSDSELIMLIRK